MEAESKSKSKVNWVWKILVVIVAALAIGATGWMIGRSGRSSSKSRGSSDSSAREERMESKNPVYEARSEFTMDTRRRRGSVNGNDVDSYGSNYEEIFKERLADWRSEALYTKIIQQYRASNPIDTVTDRELIETLRRAELELVRHSRLITIAVRSESPELAAALANAYAQAIESFTDEENKKRCDKAVAQVHAQVVKQQQEDDLLAMKLLNLRTMSRVDSLETQRIAKAEATLKQLEQEKKISSEIYQSLLQKENLQRIAAEQQNEIIRVGRPATVPTSPVNSGGSLLKR